MSTMIIQCAGCGTDVEVRRERYHPDRPYYCYTCMPEKYHLVCTNCGKVFGSRNPSTKLCPTCYAAQFHTISCAMCGEPFTCRCDSGRTLCRHCTLRENGRKNMIKYNKSDIGRAKSAEVGKHTIKYCHEAAAKINGIRHCDVCGKDAMYVVGFGCMNCHNNSDVMRKTTRDRNLYNWQDENYRHRIAQNLKDHLHTNLTVKDGVRYYKDTPVDVLSKRILSGEDDVNNYPDLSIRYGKVFYRNEDLLTGSCICERDGNRYYEDIPVEELSKRLLSGEEDINDYPGFNIRFGKVFYHNEDILTGKLLSSRYSSFMTVDGVRYLRGISVEELSQHLLSGEEDINDYPYFNIYLGRVYYRNQDILTGKEVFPYQTFHEEDGIRYYKNLPVDILCENFLSGKENINDYPDFCIRFGKVFYHNQDVLTGEELPSSDFYEKDGIRYYKGISVDVISKRLLSGEDNIDDYPGFNIRYGKVFYNNLDILTNELLPGCVNFVTVDDVRYYKDTPVEELSKRLLSGEEDINKYLGFRIRFGRVLYRN